MFKMAGKFPLYKFNSRAAILNIQKEAALLLQEATRAFVKTAYGNIPVWSGMARATLRPLASYVNIVVPISPKVKSRIGQGEASAAGSKLTYGPNLYLMEFQHDVFHLYLNDKFSMNYANGQLPTPWNAILKGSQSFFETLKGSNVYDWIKSYYGSTSLRI